MWPHRRQHTRLPYPWDSPGKNTGVGCHCLLPWTWVWLNSRRWWRIEKPGMLQSMELQRMGHDWATEQQKQPSCGSSSFFFWCKFPFLVSSCSFLVNGCSADILVFSKKGCQSCPYSQSYDFSSSHVWIGESNGSPLQYSCLENSMDRGAW